jgi:hypothetical protein
MAEDTARTNLVSSQGSILWAEDDALAKAMGTAEYSGRVRRAGLGPLPVRPTSRSFASRLSQEAGANTQINELEGKMGGREEKSR